MTGADVTGDEAIALIEATTDPRALFGRDPTRDPGREYRRLARLTHPGPTAADQHATDALRRPGYRGRIRL